MKLLNLGCGNRYHPEWVNVDFYSTGPGVISCNLNLALPFDDNSFDAVYHSHLLEHFPKCYAPKFTGECFRILRPGGIIRVVVPDLEQIVRVYLNLLEKADQGDDEACKRYDWIMIEMFDQMVRTYPGGKMLEYWKQNPMRAEDFVIERVGSEVLNNLAILRNTSNSAPHNETEKIADLNKKQNPEQIGKFRLSGEIHQWMYDRYSLKVLLTCAGFQNIRLCKANESAIPNFNSYMLDTDANGSVHKPDSLFMEAIKIYQSSV